VAITLFIVGLFSGCNEQKSYGETTPASWIVVDTGESIESFFWERNGETYSGSGISNVYISLKNTGFHKTDFIVYFKFTTKKLEKMSPHHWPNNSCLGDIIYGSIDSEKTVSISPDDIVNITCTWNPHPENILFTDSWYYQVDVKD
jgi:hypothetical protein